MKLLTGIVALLAVLLSGCSSDKLNVNPAKLQNFNSTVSFDVRWKQSVGKMGDNVLLPALTANSVFAANGEGEIQGFDRKSGKQLWRVDTDAPISGGVGAADGMVLVGGLKGDVFAYQESSGKLMWKSKVSSEVLSAPSVAEGVVVVRTGDGRVTGLDSKSGKLLWLYERATPSLVARSNAGVTIHHGIIYVGFPAGKLAAIGLHNGVSVWESSVSQPRGNTELERVSDITSLPVVDDGQVCAIAFQGRLSCFDADQGGSLWNRDISSDKGLTMLRKYLFLTDTDGTVMALDKLSGSSYWKNAQLSLRKTTAPLAFGKYLVVADYEGYLHVLNRDDGSFLARFETDGSAVRSAPVATDDGFLVQTEDGELYSLAIH